MNECEKYREMISAMLDGELDHADNERLIKHMSSCAECREMYELLSAVTGSDVWRLPEAPKDLHANIMSGVKNAADEDKRRTRMNRSRSWLAAAACLVVVVAVILGIPRISNRGSGGAPPSAILNGSAEANSAGPADTAGSSDRNVQTADQSAPASEDRPEDEKAEAASPAGAGSVSDGNGGGESGSAGDSSENAPVPEPEDEPESTPEPTEEPLPDMDIAESVVTVESGGGSVTETLSREDTFIWLRAVIEGPARGIDVAKIEIHRDEGTDYEVFFYHDGSQLMGSLTDTLADGVELNRLADFAVFEETVDSLEKEETADGTEE